MATEGQEPPGMQNESVKIQPPNPASVCDKPPEVVRAESADDRVDRRRKSLAALPPDHPDRANGIRNLGIALEARYNQSGDMTDLDSAIRCGEEVLALHPLGNPDRAESLSDLAMYLREHYERIGDLADLDTAIQYGQETLALSPPGDCNHASSLNDLAMTLAARYRQVGDVADLVRAIQYGQDALALQPPGHPGRANRLHNLALLLFTRFQRSGDLEDLNTAIQYGQDALTLFPPGHRNRATSLSNLASHLVLRFRQLGNLGDLYTAIQYGQEGLALRPPGHPDRPYSLSTLVACFQTRYQQLGDLEDLNIAIRSSQELVALRPPGNPNRSLDLCNFALLLFQRFQCKGDFPDLKDTIVYQQDALALCSPGHPDRALILTNLSTYLGRRHEQFGDHADLDTAIQYDQEALGLQAPGHPSHATTLGDLATHLAARFQRAGDLEDLNNAISYGLDALALCPTGHTNHAHLLTNLALYLGTRFQHLGDRTDLDTAITYEQEALTLYPNGHPFRALLLSDLADDLRQRFEQFHNSQDLETAIQYGHEALALRPPGHPQRAQSLAVLALCLQQRYKLLGNLTDIDDAVEYGYSALTACSPGNVKRVVMLAAVAETLRIRFEMGGNLIDIDTAINFERDVLALYPPGHSSRVGALDGLVRSLVARGFHVNCQEDHDYAAQNDDTEIISTFEQICTREMGSVSVRLSCAFEWVSFARKTHHRTITEAYSAALELLSLWVTIARSLEAQHARFAAKDIYASSRGLAEDAAALAVAQQLPRRAVEILEQGRGILFTELESYRTPLDDLPDRKVAARFAELSSQLERSLVSGQKIGITCDDDKSHQAPFVDEVEIHQKRSKELKATINLIRSSEGFEGFLKPPSYADLAEAAAEGPIIMVNISQYRSDAIIIHHGPNPEVVELPLASLNAIEQISVRLSKAVDEQSLSAGSKGCETEISEVLGLLWEFIASPVAQQLRKMKVAPGSRIWWCPTSILCSMPLHAAGIYTPGSKRCRLPDEYISSYTPTLSALIRARRTQQPALTPWKMLAVGVANPGHREKTEGQLENVSLELSQIWKRARDLTCLEGQDATHSAVLEKLPEYPWIHLACHGLQNLKNPFESRFSLQDKPLTLLEVVHARLPNAEFAFLSACHSAKGDPTAPDEALHLAAALQFVGFRSVVGSLWAMDDRDGPEVAEAFYQHMFNEEGGPPDFRSSAKGVYRIATALRRKMVPLQRWINFVHVGA